MSFFQQGLQFLNRCGAVGVLRDEEHFNVLTRTKRKIGDRDVFRILNYQMGSVCLHENLLVVFLKPGRGVCLVALDLALEVVDATPFVVLV